MEATLTLPHEKPQIVAMKTLNRVAGDTTGDKDALIERARTEMLEEARVMRIVSGHPNIVQALGVTVDDELPVAVMEKVNGESSFAYLNPVLSRIRFCLFRKQFGQIVAKNHGAVEREMSIGARGCGWLGPHPLER